MNIVTLTSSGKVVVRPDTTWEKDGEDFYVPDFVSRLSWTPVVFARMTRPGRSIGERFAGRYFESIGHGVLLYPEDLIDGSPEGFACASCLDHTSFLPGTTRPKQDSAGFTVRRDGEEIFRHEGTGPGKIEASISEVSRYCYLRTGDLVAVELQARSPLCRREDGRCTVMCIEGGECAGDAKFDIIF